MSHAVYGIYLHKEIIVVYLNSNLIEHLVLSFAKSVNPAPILHQPSHPTAPQWGHGHVRRGAWPGNYQLNLKWTPHQRAAAQRQSPPGRRKCPAEGRTLQTWVRPSWLFPTTLLACLLSLSKVIFWPINCKLNSLHLAHLPRPTLYTYEASKVQSTNRSWIDPVPALLIWVSFPNQTSPVSPGGT